MSKILPIDLYHGTSSLFLDSIISKGLGGANPVDEWELIPLSCEIYALAEEHLRESNLFLKSGAAFKRMTEQANDGHNWQHGQSYLSPAIITAVRYTIYKPYGSELLSYIFMFFDELARLDLPELKLLFRKYRAAFAKHGVRPSPVLIRASNIPVEALTDEHGRECSHQIQQIDELIHLETHLRQLYLQQSNFRLNATVQSDNLAFWMINVIKYDEHSPEFNLYKLTKEYDE